MNEFYEVEIRGTRPLLMNSCRHMLEDRNNKLSRGKEVITAEKEAEKLLYIDERGNIVVPALTVLACLRKSAYLGIVAKDEQWETKQEGTQMKLGIDIVNMDDFKRRIDKEEFVNWVFTGKEIIQCLKKVEPWKCFAGKFAVKESMLKAIYNETCKGLLLKDYEVLNDSNGKPYVKGYENALVSVSYADKYIIAVVIIE